MRATNTAPGRHLLTERRASSKTRQTISTRAEKNLRLLKPTRRATPNSNRRWDIAESAFRFHSKAQPNASKTPWLAKVSESACPGTESNRQSAAPVGKLPPCLNRSQLRWLDALVLPAGFTR